MRTLLRSKIRLGAKGFVPSSNHLQATSVAFVKADLVPR